MTLTFTDKEKRAIAALIHEHCDPYLSRFPFARYPNEPLEQWKAAFSDPATVPLPTLRQALGWQFGGWQRKSLASSHNRTILHIAKAWPEFTSSDTSAPSQAFEFWQSRLTDWQNGFNAVAFLLHLTHPDTFELTDHHRIQAMNEILQAAENPASEQPFSYSLQDLERYSSFFKAITPKLPYGNLNPIKLDRFLKAYGNRHAYKHVAASYTTQEPAIREFSWNDCAAEYFDLTKVTLRANADVLFACLLQKLDKQPEVSERLTIGQIVEHIPLGTAGICNPASYHYAMIALFGGQRGRDYFELDNPLLRPLFTEQANQSTRDMKLYLKLSAETVAINSKYRRAITT